MTRLLMILFNQRGKGTYWRALGFATELAKRSYHVTLLTAANDNKVHFVEHDVDGVRVIETPNLAPATGYDPWDTVRRLWWLRTQQFDLIHAFESRPPVIYPALNLQKRLDIPLVLDWCDWFGAGGSVEERSGWSKGWLRRLETYFEENFRARAQGSTVINTLLRQKAISLGVPENEILLLSNGVDVATIHPSDRQTLRAELGLPAGAQLLAYTGAIFAEDARLMSATFDLVAAQNPQAHLLLIGYCNLPIEKMVATPARVIRTGPVAYPTLVKYVAAADVGWLPLVNSGANQGRFPMKATDFMAAGQPLVVTDVGDLGSLARDSEIGLATADRPAAQAGALNQLLADAKTRTMMGRRARALAESDYAWPVVTDKLERFYKKVLLQARPG